MSHLDTHTHTPRSCGVSVTSSLADSNFQSALVESWRGITKLKDIVAKKLTDDKADNPQLGFCDFLKVEIVQLTSNSYDEFQQETFNLLMTLKRSDKQQRYHHGMSMSTAAYSQASTSTQCHTPRCRPCRSSCHRVTQVPQGHPQQKHLQYSQQYFQKTFTQLHALAQQQIQGQGPHLSISLTAAYSTAAAGHTPSTAAVGHTTLTAAAHTTAAASSINCPRFRAAAHATR